MFLPLKADFTVRLFPIKINGGNKSTLTGQKTSKGQLSMLTTLERLSPFSHLKMFEKHSSLSTLPQEMLIDGTIYRNKLRPSIKTKYCLQSINKQYYCNFFASFL